MVLQSRAIAVTRTGLLSLVLLFLLDLPCLDEIVSLWNRIRWRAFVSRTPTEAHGTAARRRNQAMPAGFVSASELSEQPESQVPYCPVENRFRLKRSAGSYPSKGASCERVSVEVKNSSGVRMEVFWVDSEGREVPQMVLETQQAGVIGACRGHYWRARHSYTSRVPWRLLSEMTVPARHLQPTSPSSPVLDGDESPTNDAYRWEVLACAGLRLPEAFGLKSSLGEQGNLELSRGTLGRRKTGRQEAVLKQSTSIEGLVSVTLEEAFKGKNVTVTVKRRVPCPVCHGLGAFSFVSCDRCGGSGKHTHATTLSNYSIPETTSPRGCHRPDTGTTATDAGGDHSGQHCSRGVGCEENASFYGCLCGSNSGVEGPDSKGGNDKGRSAGRLELTQTRDCAKCGGSGTVPAPTVDGEASYCTRCAGSRFVEEEAELTLSIPAGVEKGHTEVYRGQGHVDIADLLEKLKPIVAREETPPKDVTRDMGGKIQTPDLYPLHPTPHTSSSPAPSSSSGPTHASSTLSEQIRMVRRGDFRLTVDVLPHPLYSPEEGGADLHASISISLDEALTGFQRDITGLDGSIRTVRRRSRTFPGMLLRFPGLGMPLPSFSPTEQNRPRTRAGSHQGQTEESAATISSDAPKARNSLPGVLDEEGVGHVSVGSGAAKELQPAFGDLIVKASIMLPSGMRDDRSKFIGTFLKAGPPTSTAGRKKTGAEEGDSSRSS